MQFSDLEFRPHLADPNGVHGLAFFDNGYGASVVRFLGSYGNRQGKWELAVISGTKGSWGLCYSTPITDDVLGWLTEEDVTRLLGQIEALPKAEE